MSEELIRVAILWHELWHEGLEEASRLYFGEHNVRLMLNTLEPLHTMLEKGPQTMKEVSFNQVSLLPMHSMRLNYRLIAIVFLDFIRNETAVMVLIICFFMCNLTYCTSICFFNRQTQCKLFPFIWNFSMRFHSGVWS